MEFAIETQNLRKSYRDKEAVRGVTLSVRPGKVLGVLGPNGAGKTTTVRMLATLLTPDGGFARVAGFDVATEAREVRRRIGLAGQYAAVDELLTGRENLVLLGTLLHLGRRKAAKRAAELLARFDLTDAADRPLKTYSGGMRRRLDLAACIVAEPSVLFLDEPSTGLDPASRLSLWATIRGLVDEGMTVLLTTQYLEEADSLADDIAVIASGQVIAEGTPEQLKRKVGQERLELTVAAQADIAPALRALDSLTVANPAVDRDKRVIGLQLDSGIDGIASVSAALSSAGVTVTDFGIRRPTLDDVFLNLTGQEAVAH
ncbi:ATP-binding cassette domain-containing protein [Amycolatopsis sp. CA-230715]|uniref:ATP-binding cassette domain-containing protein n=1 Tax=Amycolatopsis sp. CA-230715 TaxID=2745196 RepID=UPI001C01A052|nr:ATP-binding cassette domain-containing protein [Amycolatopsis sp. CA-230715]QWF78798.1 Daunorubicin/doxorubicin resistance ATP-binding protein DrrA [Amycolatopsis sp. CA-230715]